VKNLHIENKFPEIVILTKQLMQLAFDYKTFIAEVTQAAIAVFNPHQKAIAALMPKIIAANNGKNVAFTAEEQTTLKNAAIAAKKFEAISAIFSADSKAALATQLNNAKNIQITANKYVEIDTIEHKVFSAKKHNNIDNLLKNANAIILEGKDTSNALEHIATILRTKATINSNKNIQALQPTLKDIELLKNAIEECTEWLNNISNLPEINPDKLKQIKTIVNVSLAKYNKLFQNIEIKNNAQPTTKEVLDIVSNISRKELEPKERELINKYGEDLLLIADAQNKGIFPQHEILKEQTKEQMLAKSGNSDAIAVMDIIKGKPTIAISKHAIYPEASIAHETQHLIQYKKGQLAYWGKNNNPMPWIYDIHDEVEAHKVQFLVEPISLPIPDSGVRIQNIDEITPAYLKKYYPNLPWTHLSLDSTFQEIETALGNMIQNELKPKAIFEQIVLDDGKPVWSWDTLQNMSLRLFLCNENSKGFIKAYNISFIK
jgi:hypothetical protein